MREALLNQMRNLVQFAEFPEVNQNKRSLMFNPLAAFRRKYSSIYFGGGTPSLAETKTLQELISWTKETQLLTENAEITLEANPNVSLRIQRLIFRI